MIMNMSNIPEDEVRKNSFEEFEVEDEIDYDPNDPNYYDYYEDDNGYEDTTDYDNCELDEDGIPIPPPSVLDGFNELKARTAMLMAMPEHAEVKKSSDYPAFLHDEFGIRDPAEYHDELFQLGYLINDAYEPQIYRFGHKVMLQYLKNHQFNIGDHEYDDWMLAHDIITLYSTDVCDRFRLKRYTSLSKKGRDALTKSPYFTELYTHPEIMKLKWPTNPLAAVHSPYEDDYNNCRYGLKYKG